MKPDILLVEPLMEIIEAKLDDVYKVHRLYDPAQKQTIDAAAGSIRGVVTGGGTGLANDWIERLPALGIIAINGIGTDRVDLPFARARNVDVTTTPGVLTDDVADIGMALMLAVMRRITEGDRIVRDGRWAKGEAFPLGSSPKGKRLGILGLGQIGRALARRGEAFGMAVRYYNRSPVTDVNWSACATPVALARDSDVLAVCIAASSATQNIVDQPVLDALGKNGILVNVARGSVVDEDALVQSLKSGKISGAGLDVFVGEPRIRPEFASLPNTALMPHQGSATLETRLAMGELVLSNLTAYFAGQTPPTTVN